jgi:L-threonylcarbamoyladenylate synthase
MLFQKYNPHITIGARVMQAGGVIAYPTEAVWGLGCDPHNQSAVERILELKQRHVKKGLILVAASIEQFAPYLCHLSTTHRDTLTRSWPGPFTWLVPCNDHIPSWICGEHDSVALRVSKHPYVQHLCHAFGGPIVSTSANPQGKPAPKHSWQVHHYFQQNPRLDFITKGSVGSNTHPSTITDLITGRVIR